MAGTSYWFIKPMFVEHWEEMLRFFHENVMPYCDSNTSSGGKHNQKLYCVTICEYMQYMNM